MMNYVTLKNPMMMIPFDTMCEHNSPMSPKDGEIVTLSGKKFDNVYSCEVPEGDYVIELVSGENTMFTLASEVHIMSINGEILEMKQAKPVLHVHADELSENEYNSSEEEYEVFVDGEYYKTVYEISSVDVAVKEYFAEKEKQEEYVKATKENNGVLDIDVKVKANIIREYNANVELELDSGEYEWEEK